METDILRRGGRRQSGLGNFLSGMETWAGFCSAGRRCGSLETSLVEWKLSPCGHDNCAAQTLETSLVEWKLHSFAQPPICSTALGNFLSGMETPANPYMEPLVLAALETSLVEWKRLRAWIYNSNATVGGERR